MPENHTKAERLMEPEDSQRHENRLSEYVARKYANGAKLVSPLVHPEAEPNDTGDNGVWSRINFDMMPEELVAYLDQYVVRQDEAKAVLATKVCTHFNRARYLSRTGGDDPADGVGLIKNNVLMMGPTGVGKTYLVKLIAAKLGVPFVKGDATKFSETGYVGGDVEDLIRDLVNEAGDDLELAQYGIVYIDEIDKIAGTPNLIGPDVSRTGVQRALLKPMEETEVDLKTPHDPISQIQAIEQYRRTGEREKRSVNTRHILFIMSGAFGDLAEVINRRLNKGAVGFCAEVCSEGEIQETLKQVTAQDLVSFGFENEFVGRLPVQVVLEELSSDDLYLILKNPNNPVVISKKRDFAAYGIDIRFEDEALRLLAQQASTMKTGARALVSVLERALLPFETKLPGTSIKRLLVTPDLVKAPRAMLEQVLEQGGDPSGERRFERAVRDERLELLRMIDRRQPLYEERLLEPLTPVRMDLIADEYYRSGMALGLAYDRMLDKLEEVREFEDNFYHRFSLEIKLDESAEVATLTQAAAEGMDVTDFLGRLAKVLEPGLRLAFERTGIGSFDLDEKAVLDPDGYLREFFQKNYKSPLKEGAEAPRIE